MEAPVAEKVQGGSSDVEKKTQEEDNAGVAEYVARFAGLPSRVRILPAEGSLRPLLALAGYPAVDHVDHEQPRQTAAAATTTDQAPGHDGSGGGGGGACKGCALEGVVVGLDFDQTLVVGAGLGAGVSSGVQVRGGDDTVATLQTLWAAGARLAVVTATPASPDNARLIAGLLRRLALAREFASAALDTAPLLTLLRSLAPARAPRDGDDAREQHDEVPSADATDTPAAPSTADQQEAQAETQEAEAEEKSDAAADEEEAKNAESKRESAEERRSLLERETKRIVALLALSTGRRPGDLVRIGHSTIAFDTARAKATYRLAQVTGPNIGGWSAMQSLAAHEERELCAVDCLETYMQLTASRRTREGSALPDRLLLSLDDDGGALDENAVSKMLEEVLIEAGINPQSTEARELFQDSAELVTLDGGVKIARYRHIMCARYNKPEALLDFVTRLGQAPPKKILFVDDNSDNVFNMFHFFASRQLEQLAQGKAVEETTSIISCWYPPPEGGKAENHDPQLLVLLRRMAAL